MAALRLCKLNVRFRTRMVQGGSRLESTNRNAEIALNLQLLMHITVAKALNWSTVRKGTPSTVLRIAEVRLMRFPTENRGL